MKTYIPIVMLLWQLLSFYNPSLQAQCTMNITASGPLEFCEGDSIELEASPGFVAYVWSTTETTQSIWVHSSGSYIVGGVTITGCIAADTIEVEVFPETALEIDPDPGDEICIGDSVILDAIGGPFTMYWWNTGVSGTASITDFPAMSMLYVVEALDTNGCESRDELWVEVESCDSTLCEIEIESNGPPELCEGDSLLLEATSGFIAYDWNVPGTGHIVWVHEGGWYTVHALTADSCLAVDSIYITEFPHTPIEIEADPDDEVCLGDSVILTALGGPFTMYWWNTGTNGTDSILVFPSTSGLYVVEAIDSNGCESRDEIWIEVESCDTTLCEIVIEADGPPELCEGDSLLLEATSGFIAYDWNVPGSGHIVWVHEGGWYTVHALTADSCLAVDSIYITEFPHTPIEIEADPDDEVCLGDSVILTALGGPFTMYWWNTGANGTDSILVFPTTSGLYVVEAIDSNGCDARDEIWIEVESCDSTVCEVVIESGSPTNSLCEGDSLLLEATSGFIAYDWNVPGSGHIVWVHEGGWYTVHALTADSCLAVDSIYIEEFPAPDILIHSTPDPAEICAGDSIILTLVGAFVEFEWSNGATTTSIEVYPLQNTLYEVFGVDSNGCEAEAHIWVEVENCDTTQCDIFVGSDGPPVICPGDEILIEAENGFAQYQWNTGDTTRLIHADEEGWYIVYALTQDGCLASDSIYIEAYPEPNLEIFSNPDPPVICIGQTITLEASGGFLEYYWKYGQTTQSIVEDPIENETIWVVVLDSNECEWEEAIHVEVDSCSTNITDMPLNELWHIYPNPVSDLLNLEWQGNQTSLWQISIYDLNGALILRNNTIHSIQIPMDGLPAGFYMLLIQNDQHIFHYKFLKR